ncbi:MAG TPA: tetratricopeptide repeat protein [Candidatus Dormibacteraeota bacterium]|nr:tetratricopeptide repeat protein [Candidatus Dormibacteraeota bacterium]
MATDEHRPPPPPQSHEPQGRSDDAASELQAAVAERPDRIEARSQLGRALLAAGRAPEASTR